MSSEVSSARATALIADEPGLGVGGTVAGESRFGAWLTVHRDYEGPEKDSVRSRSAYADAPRCGLLASIKVYGRTHGSGSAEAGQ
jgi:hypothetical protein